MLRLAHDHLQRLPRPLDEWRRTRRRPPIHQRPFANTRHERRRPQYRPAITPKPLPQRRGQNQPRIARDPEMRSRPTPALPKHREPVTVIKNQKHILRQPRENLPRRSHAPPRREHPVTHHHHALARAPLPLRKPHRVRRVKVLVLLHPKPRRTHPEHHAAVALLIHHRHRELSGKPLPQRDVRRVPLGGQDRRRHPEKPSDLRFQVLVSLRVAGRLATGRRRRPPPRKPPDHRRMHIRMLRKPEVVAPAENDATLAVNLSNRTVPRFKADPWHARG